MDKEEWTSERKISFWKLLGWRAIKHKDCHAPSGELGRRHPEGVCHYEHGDSNEAHIELPDITSLDVLFEHAIPTYVEKTGKDFITIPTTLSREELVLKIAAEIELALKD